MREQPEKRSAVILGATGGIGSAVARRLRRTGWQVFLAARSETKLASLAAELDCPYVSLEAASEDSVDACVAEAAERFGHVTGLVNCVGSLLLKPAHLTKYAEWQEVLAANLTTAFVTVKAAARQMKKGGSVVLFSSAAGRIGIANHEAIAAAKAGVIGLTQSAAATYAARRLRFNAVAPGLVKTPLTQQIWSNPRAAEASTAMHASGRLGEPNDVASIACWLLSEENDWVTGEVFSVDGGLATVRAMPRPRHK